jgi:KDO2-lipid IV(A) lauroyltransferase
LHDDSGFKLIFREASKDLATMELEPATVQMNMDVEKLIRETPHQYQWTYKRFKVRPQGEPPLY